MLAYSASATRHDTYITYTLTRAVDGSDERADFLGCAIHVRKELITSLPVALASASGVALAGGGYNA